MEGCDATRPGSIEEQQEREVAIQCEAGKWCDMGRPYLSQHLCIGLVDAKRRYSCSTHVIPRLAYGVIVGKNGDSPDTHRESGYAVRSHVAVRPRLFPKKIPRPMQVNMPCIPAAPQMCTFLNMSEGLLGPACLIRLHMKIPAVE
jgi:hypothetical protein